MIDTIRVEIPLSSKDTQKIENGLDTHLIISNGTGHIASQFTRAQLSGSYDSKISIFIGDKKWELQEVAQPDLRVTNIYTITDRTPLSVPVLVDTDPFLRLEFSLPKVTDGVNFLNSTVTMDILKLIKVKSDIEKHFNINLPSINDWVVTRCDIGLNYNLITEDAVFNFFSMLKNAEYPRRKTAFYDGGVYFPGIATTTKIYSKYKEFKKHDYQRFKTICKTIAYNVYNLTKGIVRFETELKKRWLVYRNIKTIKDLLDFDLNEVLQGEVYKIMNTMTLSKVYRRQDVVKTLKQATIKNISCDVVISIWDSIAMRGKKYAKQVHGKDKFYRAKRVLKDLQIPLTGKIYEKTEPKANIISIDSYRIVSDSYREIYLQTVGFDA